ncbi:hypothetical protein [Corynebacterium renale]|uniref:hypothetical protein n=1 Tax=Corynebacterium renale TaxID=1724 RepID=UPI000E031509|nr:hypothetical protein [Corynebacterium renale]STC97559.1 Uncharacterised protein [Corynebacterium renale]
MSFVPVTHVVEMSSPGVTIDPFGNEMPTEGQWREVTCAAWWVDKSEEQTGDSVQRIVDALHLLVPIEVDVQPATQIRLPDSSVWQVQGHPENYEHGFHGFRPGLVVIHAQKVEG